MKILRVSAAYYPAISLGGAVTADLVMDRALVELGHEVKVVTTNAGLEKLPADVEILNQIDGIRVIRYNYYGYIHYTFSPLLFYNLGRHIKKADLILISGVWNFPVAAAAFFARLYNKPHVIVPHGLLYRARINGKSSFKKKIYYTLFSQRDLKNSVIMATCEDEIKEIYHLCGKKVRVILIPNSLDRKEYSAGLIKEKIRDFRKLHFPPDSKVIGFHGRINWVKGLDNLIGAFSKLDKCILNNAYLMIIGPDDEGYSERLKKIALDKGILDRIKFMGLLKDEQLKTAISAADVSVLSSYAENFGMSVIEALALGVPIIISDKVGVSEKVKLFDAGIVCQANAESVSSALNSFLLNEVDANKMIMNGYKLIDEEFAPITNAKKLMRSFL